MELRARLWRCLPLGLLATAGAILMYVVGDLSSLLHALTENGERLRMLAQAHTIIAAATYTAIYAVLMTTLWVPAWLCSIAGGFIFGVQLGTPCALAGATLGASAVFLLARAGLAGTADLSGALARRLQDGFLAGGVSYLIAARLIPILPFSAVNIVAATTRVSLRTYVAATALGVIPSTLVYTGVGNGLGESLETKELLRPSLTLPLVCLAALLVVTFLCRVVRAHVQPNV